MIINKLKPQGFCGGVNTALKKLDEAINNPSTLKPIYLLGSIIHNEHIINEYKNKGVILIEDKNKTRLELLNEIKEGTVVFSAHGVSPKVYEKAKLLGLNIIDTTCANVSIIHTKITEHLNIGYTCIYIGNNHHPECEGILGISDDIILVSNQNDINNLKISNDKIYITNQTTLSLFDINDLYEALRNKFPNCKIDNKICLATTLRQKAIIDQEKVDMCIIVGDKTSSNTSKLVSTGNKIGIKTILVDNLDDIKKIDFTNVKSISISSGASTPSYLVDEIIEYLEK